MEIIKKEYVCDVCRALGIKNSRDAVNEIGKKTVIGLLTGLRSASKLMGLRKMWTLLAFR